MQGTHELHATECSLLFREAYDRLPEHKSLGLYTCGVFLVRFWGVESLEPIADRTLYMCFPVVD